MSTKLLRLPEVLRKTGLSRSGIYAKEAIGHFPDRVSLGPRAVAWRETEVDEWIKALESKKQVCASKESITGKN